VTGTRHAARRRGRAAAFAAVLVVTGVLGYPLCDGLHRCGCALPWSGGEAACNVHLRSGPHCPWCEHRLLGAGAFAAIVAVQWSVFAVATRRGAKPARAALLAAVSLAAAGPLVGALAWTATDYPHFLVRDARQRLGLPAGPLRCVAKPAEVGAACCR
jgi:hypothetical protein